MSFDRRGKSFSHGIGHDKRSRPVKGYGDDDGRYYRCWNCDFMCNKDRDGLNDLTTERAGYTNMFEVHWDNGNAEENARATLAVNGGSVGHHTVAMQANEAGEAQVPVHAHKIDGSNGCPFCGTTNWA